MLCISTLHPRIEEFGQGLKIHEYLCKNGYRRILEAVGCAKRRLGPDQAKGDVLKNFAGVNLRVSFLQLTVCLGISGQVQFSLLATRFLRLKSGWPISSQRSALRPASG